MNIHPESPHPRRTEIPEMTGLQAEALSSRLEYESWIARIDEVLNPGESPSGGPEKRALLKSIEANFDDIEIDPEAFPDDELIRLRNGFELQAQSLRRSS